MGVVFRARQVSLEPAGRPEDDPGGATAPPTTSCAGSGTRPRRSPASTTRSIVPIYEVGEHEGQPLLLDEADRGRQPRRAARPSSPATPAPRPRLVADGRRGGPPRPPARHPAPRPQAGQHPARPPTAAPTSPTSAWPSGSSGDGELTGSRRDPRHPAVHGPRAGRGPTRRRDHGRPTSTASGAILYALLTGRPPFRSRLGAGDHRAGPSKPPEPPRPGSTRGLRRDLETICLKCLEKDPRRRYASAEALADDLRLAPRRPIAARPVGRGERAGGGAVATRLSRA